jgi:hypothetical protein
MEPLVYLKILWRIKMAIPEFEELDISRVSFDTIEMKKPQFSVIIGKGGIGKTSLACYSIGDCIILPIGRETGHEEMPVHKFDTFDKMGLSPIEHVFTCFSWILKHPRAENLKTLIIDNVGAYREIVDEDVIRSRPRAKVDGEIVDIKSLTDYGFGKGAAMAYPYWTRLLKGIDAVMKRRNMNVILIGHEGYHTVNRPDGSYYQRISINAPSGANTDVVGLIEARCHNFFYMDSEVTTATDKRGMPQNGKHYAKREDITRIIYTKEQGDVFAKCRADMNPIYEIMPSESKDELLKKRNNESIIKFWNDVYRIQE